MGRERVLKTLSIALGVSLAFCACIPSGASAQKIIHVNTVAPHAASKQVRVRKFGRVVPSKLHSRQHLRTHRILKRKRHGITVFSAFALPDQHLFPPYYEADRPWSQRPDMASRIKGGKTVEGGSRYASHIKGGKTVEGGSRYASHIEGGKTVEGGSRYASHIKGGKTVEQGSPWRSTMSNWRFSGYEAPMRPKGIPYYRAQPRARSPWAGRRY